MIYGILYKTLIGPKPLPNRFGKIRFDKIDRFIRIYDRTRYLTFYGSEKYDAIKERSFCVDLFSRVIFLTFCVDLISRIGYRLIFREYLYSRILVLSLFYITRFFSWFAFQLVVCESWNSYPNISISQIALFGYNRLNP